MRVTWNLPFDSLIGFEVVHGLSTYREFHSGFMVWRELPSVTCKHGAELQLLKNQRHNRYHRFLDTDVGFEAFVQAVEEGFVLPQEEEIATLLHDLSALHASLEPAAAEAMSQEVRNVAHMESPSEHREAKIPARLLGIAEMINVLCCYSEWSYRGTLPDRESRIGRLIIELMQPEVLQTNLATLHSLWRKRAGFFRALRLRRNVAATPTPGGFAQPRQAKGENVPVVDHPFLASAIDSIATKYLLTLPDPGDEDRLLHHRPIRCVPWPNARSIDSSFLFHESGHMALHSPNGSLRASGRLREVGLPAEHDLTAV